MNTLKSSEDQIELSFIFPCLNEKDTIDTCLKEVTKQTSNMKLLFPITVQPMAHWKLHKNTP